MSPVTVSNTSATSSGIMEFESIHETKTASDRINSNSSTSLSTEIKKPVALNNLNDIYGFDFYAPPNTSVAVAANAIASEPANVEIKQSNIDDDDDDWVF